MYPFSANFHIVLWSSTNFCSTLSCYVFVSENIKIEGFFLDLSNHFMETVVYSYIMLLLCYFAKNTSRQAIDFESQTILDNAIEIRDMLHIGVFNALR